MRISSPQFGNRTFYAEKPAVSEVKHAQLKVTCGYSVPGPGQTSFLLKQEPAFIESTGSQPGFVMLDNEGLFPHLTAYRDLQKHFRVSQSKANEIFGNLETQINNFADMHQIMDKFQLRK